MPRSAVNLSISPLHNALARRFGNAVPSLSAAELRAQPSRSGAPRRVFDVDAAGLVRPVRRVRIALLTAVVCS